jgi:hypothetical protein
MKTAMILILTLTLTACESLSMSHQTVAYVDAYGVNRDALGRDATDAGLPLCSEVTLRPRMSCRVR